MDPTAVRRDRGDGRSSGTEGLDALLEVYRTGGRGAEGLPGRILSLNPGGSEYEITGSGTGCYSHRLLFLRRLADGAGAVLKILEPVDPELLSDEMVHDTPENLRRYHFNRSAIVERHILRRFTELGTEFDPIPGVRTPIAPRLRDSIEVRDPGNSGKQLVIAVMDRIDGEPLLDAVLRGLGGLPPERIATYLAQVVRHAATLAEHGVYYLDLSPRNMMIRTAEAGDHSMQYAYLIDFSVACLSPEFQSGVPFTAPFKGFLERTYRCKASESAVVCAIADALPDLGTAVRNAPGRRRAHIWLQDAIDSVVSQCAMPPARRPSLAQVQEYFERLAVIAQSNDPESGFARFRWGFLAGPAGKGSGKPPVE